MEDLTPQVPEKRLGKKMSTTIQSDPGPRTVRFDRTTEEFSYDNVTGKISVVCKKTDPLKRTIYVDRGSGEPWKFVQGSFTWDPKEKIGDGRWVLTGRVEDHRITIEDLVETSRPPYKYGFTIEFGDGTQYTEDPELQNVREVGPRP